MIDLFSCDSMGKLPVSGKADQKQVAGGIVSFVNFHQNLNKSDLSAHNNYNNNLHEVQ